MVWSIHHSLLLFAVVNPIGNIPVYADLTRELEKRERARVMNLAVLTALFVVVVFTLIGDWSLAYLFNVTVAELEIAGGILLFIIALRGILPPRGRTSIRKTAAWWRCFPSPFPSWSVPARSRSRSSRRRPSARSRWSSRRWSRSSSYS